ncbi:MAG: hypothetical protein KAW46_00575 [candidate division Zixibacteria bacterium]|nr:hypothetical protein [candidate division Zixibacteria bacterium]
MTVNLSKLLILAIGGLLLLGTGGNTLASSNIEVFVDLDGDGFDDHESDVNKDGVPDLVVPVQQPKILASAGDIFGAETEWSAAYSIHLQCCVVRGSVDNDDGGAIDISDLVYLVDYMFTGGPPPPGCTP